jgi:copper chaperone CopZ
VILHSNVLREKEVNEIKAAIKKLEGIFIELDTYIDETSSDYGLILGTLKNYEETIDSYSNFRTIPISVFRSFTMFVGEFDGEKFDEPLRMFMLLLFIFFMTITLQNLMNSIALIDVQEIIHQAQIIGIKKRISLVFSYENLFEIFFENKFEIFSRNNINRFVLTPRDSRKLVLFDPLKVHKGRTDKLLVLSKTSVENIVNHCSSKLKTQ